MRKCPVLIGNAQSHDIQEWDFVHYCSYSTPCTNFIWVLKFWKRDYWVGKKKKWFLSTIHRIAASLWMVLFMSVSVGLQPPSGLGSVRPGSRKRPASAPLCALPSGGPWLLTSPSSWKETATGCGCFCICGLSVSPEHCKWFLLNIIVLFWSVFLKLNF